MNKDLITDIAAIRVCVGYLGEKENHTWWQSSFFSNSSEAFLKPVFNKTLFSVQYYGIKSAATIVHDDHIGVGIVDILGKAPLRKIWLTADAKEPINWEKTNQSLANALSNGSLQNRIDQTLNDLENHDNAILLVTDIEALHPYMRIGAIERNLQGEFNSPTVFFYPGERTGKTRLKFLGFYPDDGNYRSIHVGG